MNRKLIVAIVITCSIIGIHLYSKGFSNGSIYEIAVNLSYSFLAAVIFYVLQTVIPDNKRKRKAKIILQGSVNKIADKLDFLVAFSNLVLTFENDAVTIKGVKEGDIIYFRKTKNQQVIQTQENYREFFQTCIEIIKNDIQFLKSNSLYSFLDENLITVIAEIEKETFSNFRSLGQLYPVCKRYQNLQEDINRLDEYYSRLSVYIDDKGRWSAEFLNEDEIRENIKLRRMHEPSNKAVSEFLNKTVICKR